LDPRAGAPVDRDRYDCGRREIRAREPCSRDRDEEQIERDRNQREAFRAALFLKHFRSHNTHGRTPVIGSESKTSEPPSASAIRTIALDFRTLKLGVARPTMQPNSATQASTANRGQAGA